VIEIDHLLPKFSF